MPKNKPCKGLLKRIRFTKSGKVKFGRSFGRHLKSHKSGKLKRSYRKPAYAKSCDVKRVRSMLFTRVTAGDKARPAETAEA
jgi:ribosomal protein L35